MYYIYTSYDDITSAAIAALLIAIVAVRKKRHSSAKYTPKQQEQESHTSMTLNLSVKRISNTFSYTSKP